jgi:dynein heavy chain 1
MLSKIQKALGDYLEKQRQSFARFYFVGDEDLLEIIGNSKDVRLVQRHFPKMFAGITSLKFEKEGDQLDGMVSREGEYVEFSKEILISEDPTIHVWLTKVEHSMQICLAHQLLQAINEMLIIHVEDQQEDFSKWIEKFPAQIVILSMQVSWSNKVEECLKTAAGAKSLQHVDNRTKSILELLADRVLTDLEKDIRQKYEQLITDLVHQREVTQQLINQQIQSISDFAWLYHMRFYFNHKQKNALEQLQIKLANGNFFYGFEYLGVGEKLVQTPLTDRCYLTLTQALHWRLGGSPFGPAGTGKTESVKALGSQLGRYVLVFNCDETFDGNAMGRIFVGLCQVGAWGCFDEFNRLEERMLSAVSQQILIIQMGLKHGSKRIDIMGRDVKLDSAMGIFITMNPDYAGRSNLPDNLKQLFRQIAMVKPNKEMIARVKLYSQGFKSAEKLSGKIVSLFDLCLNQLSAQSHYDFGLRALKSVLVSSGNLKRAEKATLADPLNEIDDDWEQTILIRSLCATLVPKLIA